MRVLVTGGSGFIGTNLVAALLGDGIAVLNVDLEPPLDPRHASCWRRTDILDLADLRAAFEAFGPTQVVHLAARTDCDERTTVERGYRVNTEGTANVLEAVQGLASVERLIVASSQFVCGPGHVPARDDDYRPHTVYGASKAIAEDLTRAADPACTWTIIRPTNVWGPWHLRYRREAWRVLERGAYLHPGRAPVVRTYGYVGNLVWQMRRILEAPPAQVHGRTLYLGDRPVDIYRWVDGFSRQLRGRPARVAPRWAVRGLGYLGDVLARAGVRFPITSSRYRSMTQDYRVPVEPALALLGEPPYALEQGVAATVAWLRSMDRMNGTDRASPRRAPGRATGDVA